MSAIQSPSCGRRYGIARVCQAWEFSRSTVYSRLAAPDAEPKRRGPEPLGVAARLPASAAAGLLLVIALVLQAVQRPGGAGEAPALALGPQPPAVDEEGYISNIARGERKGIAASVTPGRPYFIECINNAADEFEVRVEVWEREAATPLHVALSYESVAAIDRLFRPSTRDVDIRALKRKRGTKFWHLPDGTEANQINQQWGSMAWAIPHINVELFAYTADHHERLLEAPQFRDRRP